MTGGWRRVSRERAAVGGAGGASATGVALGVTGFAVVACAAWCVWAWVRPLPGAVDERASVGEVPMLPALEHDGLDVAARDGMLERLGRDNVWASDRRFWPEPRTVADASAGDADEQAGVEAEPEQEPAEPAPAVAVTDGDGVQEIVLTPDEDVPDDVKAALSDLELFGIFVGADERSRAMIGLKKSPQRGVTTAYEAGDAFTDPAHDRSPWVVARVQPARHRVVLVRSGVTVARRLFPEGLATLPARPTEEMPDRTTPHVETRNADQIAAELRAQGVSEEDIRLSLALMAGETTAAATVVEDDEGDGLAGVDDAGGAGGAPQGMTELLRMMQNASKQAEEERRNREERRRGGGSG